MLAAAENGPTMRKRLKSVLILSLVLLAFAFGGYRVWVAYEKKNSSAAASASKQGGARVITVSTAQARTVQIRGNIEITGSLKPKEQVDVTSKVTGRVERLTAQVGDLVQRGQLIAELEDSELEQQVRRAEAARDVARATVQQRNAELGNAKADADRAKQLLEQGLVAKQDYDTKLTAYRVFEAQVSLANAQTEQAGAELRELNIQRSQMKIVAPLSGYVAQRYVDVGAVVSPSTPIVKLVNLSTMVTVANVPERDVSKLRVGSPATVAVDAFGDNEFQGKVARISPVLDAATRTALVEVEIANPAGALKAEMFARVKLDVANTRNAVLIPRDALVYRGDQAGVYVLVDQKPVFRPVQIGASQGSDIEVTANLSSGATVVNRGAAMLQAGDQIRIVETKDAELNKPRSSGAGPNASPAITGAGS
jgi:RND family efflux transporter MFP subunit